MSEEDLQQAVIDLAETLGWLCYHTHDSRRSQPGFPDLVMVRAPRILFAELKADKGVITNEQHQWMLALRETPAEVHLWRPEHWNDETIEKALR